MPREVLPNRRSNYSFTITFQGERYDVTVGCYSDGRIGELFINRIRDKVAARVGIVLDGVCRDAAIIFSIALQHGADVETVRHAVTRDEDGTPATIVGAILDHLLQEPPDDPDAPPRSTPLDPTSSDPSGPTTGGSDAASLPPTPLDPPSRRE